MKTNSELWNRLLKNENFKEKFNKYNKSIADSLYVSNQQEHNVLGREDEIERLRGIMERPLTPVALLIGQAGTGKTALVQEFAKQSKLHNYVVLSLRLGTLGALDSGSLKNALANILNNLKTLQDEARVVLEDDNFEIILFVDEIHMIVTIFGPGTKIGGDVLKDILTKPPIKVIGATTQREYDSTIATDKPLAERFKQIEIKELPKGSTIIDFAYKIHSEVGNTMTKAKVNGISVDLDYVLKNKDRVQIITDPLSNGPSKDWLDKAITTYAKRR